MTTRWVCSGMTTLGDQFMRWTRAAYYLVGFDRAFPGKARAAEAVQRWELEHGKGDTPKPQAKWDAQYATGEWAYMGRLDETSRYGVIVAYLMKLASNGTV